MSSKLKIATTADAPAIALLRVAVAEALTSRHGKCGFREVGRAEYRKVPLVYFEMLL